eukprot:GHVL01013075.1.p1 GENE.GHVL01013075.1~~GHVL01013075.1.p1  ORF type:complete len:1827 (-),score=454.13 GHVL01013075.1:1487-6967(-)
MKEATKPGNKPKSASSSSGGGTKITTAGKEAPKPVTRRADERKDVRASSSRGRTVGRQSMSGKEKEIFSSNIDEGEKNKVPETVHSPTLKETSSKPAMPKEAPEIKKPDIKISEEKKTDGRAKFRESTTTVPTVKPVEQTSSEDNYKTLLNAVYIDGQCTDSTMLLDFCQIRQLNHQLLQSSQSDGFNLSTNELASHLQKTLHFLDNLASVSTTPGGPPRLPQLNLYHKGFAHQFEDDTRPPWSPRRLSRTTAAAKRCASETAIRREISHLRQANRAVADSHSVIRHECLSLQSRLHDVEIAQRKVDSLRTTQLWEMERELEAGQPPLEARSTNHLVNQISSLQHQLTEEQKLSSMLRKEIEALVIDKERHTDNLGEEDSNLLSEKQVLITGLSVENSELRNQIESLLTDGEMPGGTLGDAMVKKIEELERSHDMRKNALKEVENELRQELDKKHDEITRLETELKTLCNRCDEQNTEIQYRDRLIAEYKETIDAGEAEISKLRDMMEYNDAMESKDCERLNDEIARVLAEKKEMETNLRKENEQLHNDVDDLQNDLNNGLKANEELFDEISSREKQISKFESEKELLLKEEARLKKELRSLQNENDMLKNELEREVEEVKNLTKKLNSGDEANDGLNDRMDDILSKNELMNEELEFLREFKTRTEQDKAELQRQLDESIVKYRDVRDQIEESQEKMKGLANDLENLVVENKAAKNQLMTLEKTNITLERELEGIRLENSSMAVRLDEDIDEKKKIQDNCDNLEQRIKLLDSENRLLSERAQQSEYSDNLAKKLDEAEDFNQSQKLRVKEMEALLHLSQSKNEDLKAQLSNNCQNYFKLEAEMNERANTISDLTQQLNERSNMLEELENNKELCDRLNKELSEKIAASEAFEEQLEDATNRAIYLQTKLSTSTEEQENLNKDILNVMSDNSELTDQMKKMENELNELKELQINERTNMKKREEDHHEMRLQFENAESLREHQNKHILQLQEDVRRRDEKNESLLSDVAKLTTECQHLRKEIDNVSGREEEMTHKLHDEVGALREKNIDLLKQLQELEMINAKNENSNEDIIQSLKNDVRTLEAENADLQTKIIRADYLSSEIKNLTNDKKILQDQITNLQEEVDRLMMEQSADREKENSANNEELMECVRQYKEKLEDLQNAHDQLKDANDVLYSQIETLEDSNHELTDKNEQMSDQVKTLLDEKKNFDNEILEKKNISQQMDELMFENENLKRQVNAHDEELAEMKKTFDQIDNTKEINEDLKNKIDKQLLPRIDALLQENTSLSDELRNMKTDNEEAHMRSKSFENECEQLKSDLKEAENNINYLKRSDEKDDLLRQIRNLKEDIEILKYKNSVLDAEADGRLQDVMTENESLKSQLKNSEREMRDLRARQSGSGLNEKIKALTEEKQGLMVQIKSLKTANDVLDRDNKDIEADMEIIKANNEKLMDDYNNLNAKYKGLQNKESDEKYSNTDKKMQTENEKLLQRLQDQDDTSTMEKKTMQKQIDDVIDENKKLLKKLDNVMKDMTDLQAEKKELTNAINILTKEKNTLEEDIKILRSGDADEELKKLKKEYASIVSELRSMKDEKQHGEEVFKNKLDALQEQNKILKEDLRKYARSEESLTDDDVKLENSHLRDELETLRILLVQLRDEKHMLESQFLMSQGALRMSEESSLQQSEENNALLAVVAGLEKKKWMISEIVPPQLPKEVAVDVSRDPIPQERFSLIISGVQDLFSTWKDLDRRLSSTNIIVQNLHDYLLGDSNEMHTILNPPRIRDQSGLNQSVEDAILGLKNKVAVASAANSCIEEALRRWPGRRCFYEHNGVF